MADQIQIQITYANTIGNSQTQIRGYVNASDVSELRQILYNAPFIELKDEDGSVKAWINRDHAAKIRIVDGTES